MRPSFTIDPNVVVPPPEEQLPAMGITPAQGEQLHEASVEYVGENEIALEAAGSIPGEITVTVTYPDGELPEGATVFWEWGDGSSEVGDDLVQSNTYTMPGTYTITATIASPAEPTVRVQTVVA